MYLQVFDRLNKLNLCVSHTATVSIVTALGKDHNKEVKKWRDEISQFIEDKKVCQKLHVLVHNIL